LSVKNDAYLLYVNGAMLKGANVKVGRAAQFVIELDSMETNISIDMPLRLKRNFRKINW
jgi:hypothetical protein